MEKKELFRQVALNRLSSPEQLDSFLLVTSSKGWLALIGIGLFIFTMLFWAVYGRLPTKLSAQQCILMSGDGIKIITATTGGRLAPLPLNVGDQINRGQIIAKIVGDVVPTAKKNSDSGTINGPIIYTVTSPYDGRVVEIRASEGQLVERGMQLLSIEAHGQRNPDIKAYIYLPASDGKKVRANMKVEISPGNATREEFGFLLAKVSTVAIHPSTDQGLMQIFGNEKVVRQLSGMGAPIQILASLKPSSRNASGYEWASRSGPPFPLESGTSCVAAITISERRPIELIIPLLKKWNGLN
jgi:HlyD family secretion protein